MGDDAVVLEGAESEKARTSLCSTIHGAGRVLGRKDAKRRLTRAQMDAWLRKRGVTLIGADLDESPVNVAAHRSVIARFLMAGYPLKRWAMKMIRSEQSKCLFSKVTFPWFTLSILKVYFETRHLTYRARLLRR